MSVFGLFDAKNRLSELVERAKAGEEVVISKRGRPAARLVACEGPDETELRARRMTESMARVAAIRDGLKHRIPLEELLAERHEAHRY